MNAFIQKQKKPKAKQKKTKKTPKKPPQNKEKKQKWKASTTETCNKWPACKNKEIFPLKDCFREGKKINVMGMHVLFRSVTLKDNLTY